MFVQVFQGPVSDKSAARAAFDRWTADLAPGAEGWLGSTAGVTDDGTLVALARFESEEAARRNSDRPEQGAWWADFATNFTSEPVFHDSTTVDVDTAGDPDSAGFVQIMQGRSTDPERGRQLMADDSIDWASYRPDVLGTLMVHHDGDQWTMAIYFTSEADAREGEQKPPPPEVEAMQKELDSIAAGPPTFFDLRDPWLSSPD